MNWQAQFEIIRNEIHAWLLSRVDDVEYWLERVMAILRIYLGITITLLIVTVIFTISAMTLQSPVVALIGCILAAVPYILFLDAARAVGNVAGAATKTETGLPGPPRDAIQALFRPFALVGAVFMAGCVAIFFQPEFMHGTWGWGLIPVALFFWVVAVHNNSPRTNILIHLLTLGVVMVLMFTAGREGWDWWQAREMAKPGMVGLQTSQDSLEESERDLQASENNMKVASNKTHQTDVDIATKQIQGQIRRAVVLWDSVAYFNDIGNLVGNLYLDDEIFVDINFLPASVPSAVKTKMISSDIRLIYLSYTNNTKYYVPGPSVQTGSIRNPNKVKQDIYERIELARAAKEAEMNQIQERPFAVRQGKIRYINTGPSFVAQVPGLALDGFIGTGQQKFLTTNSNGFELTVPANLTYVVKLAKKRFLDGSFKITQI